VLKSEPIGVADVLVLVPLVEIAALPQRDPATRDRVIGAVVAEVAATLGAPAEAVWVVWRSLEPGAYAVGAARPVVQPPDSHPPLVRVFIARPPEAVERVVETIERVLVREFALTEEPFVIVERPHEPDATP
jgi:phenylpyruvate tautomerase PptA (4-oxalocrotonate tautomerase family)